VTRPSRPPACIATGRPKVTLVWLRIGVPILEADKEFEAKSEDKEDDTDPMN
jgi:hypothetical protein